MSAKDATGVRAKARLGSPAAVALVAVMGVAVMGVAGVFGVRVPTELRFGGHEFRFQRGE